MSIHKKSFMGGGFILIFKRRGAYTTVNDRIPDAFENQTYLCSVLEWLKQDGDH
jgi:hypothetical protein